MPGAYEARPGAGAGAGAGRWPGRGPGGGRAGARPHRRARCRMKPPAPLMRLLSGRVKPPAPLTTAPHTRLKPPAPLTRKNSQKPGIMGQQRCHRLHTCPLNHQQWSHQLHPCPLNHRHWCHQYQPHNQTPHTLKPPTPLTQVLYGRMKPPPPLTHENSQKAGAIGQQRCHRFHSGPLNHRQWCHQFQDDGLRE